MADQRTRVSQAPAASAAAAQRAVVLDPSASEVTFTLDTTFHEVHGTMGVVGGTIRFDPATGAASGEITVAARCWRASPRASSGPIS